MKSFTAWCKQQKVSAQERDDIIERRHWTGGEEMTRDDFDAILAEERERAESGQDAEVAE